MIATITLNPSVDKCYQVAEVIKGKVIRVDKVENTAGGKGLNVSRVIRLLGEKVTATGFLGGRNGQFITEQLQLLGVDDRFVRIKGETRSCLAIISRDGAQTEVLEPGPLISRGELAKWLAVYDTLLSQCSYICASGSLPSNLPSALYRELIEKAKQKQVQFLLDTSGKSLRAGIEGGPFFVKPNRDELEMLAGKPVRGKDAVLEQVDYLQSKGIACVVISLGRKGAIAGIGNKRYQVIVPRVDAVNSVGSGDSFVAGFAVGLQRGYTDKALLAFACACGSANAMEPGTGVVNPDTVDKLLGEVQVMDL